MAWYSVEQLGDRATRNEHIVYVVGDVVVGDVARKYMALGPQCRVQFSTVLYDLGSFGKIGCICVILSKPKRSSTAVVAKLAGIVRLKSSNQVRLFGLVPLLYGAGHNW